MNADGPSPNGDFDPVAIAADMEWRIARWRRRAAAARRDNRNTGRHIAVAYDRFADALEAERVAATMEARQ